MFSRQLFSENSTKRFLARTEGHLNNEKMLRIIRRHSLSAILPVIRVAVSYRKGQLRLKKIDVLLKSTSARPPIYDRSTPETHPTVSPGNPVGVTKPSLLLMFVIKDDKSLEESSLTET